MPTCKEIFEAMPSRFRKEAAGDWNTVIQFHCSGDGGGAWVLTVKDGACEVAEGTAESPKAVIHTDAATWVGINTGAVNAMVAFTTNKLKIEGNMGDVLKLNNPSVFKKG
jgi:putative sterol carrier protein